MKPAVILLGFGEPEAPTPDVVAPFLERIFVRNARLDPSTDPVVILQRARAMAERRLPGLLEDYRSIGGSPLNAQVARQAGRLEEELAERGHDVLVLTGMQFTDPGIPAAVERASRAGADRVVAVPLYPLSGPSTTMAALEDLRHAVDRMGWEVPIRELAGWHAHPAYTALLADGVRGFCAREGVALDDPDTRLVFSAHGTPIRYLKDGSRYAVYVEDHCRAVASALGIDGYQVGFQNHGNRPDVDWTQPGIDDVVRGIDARQIVVVPVSFVQEQSETLAELDIGLRAVAEGRGVGFHRVPVPHDDPPLIRLLADLVAPLLTDPVPESAGLVSCRCRPVPGTLCLNGGRPRS